MSATNSKQPRTVPTALAHAVKNQRRGFARTAEQYNTTKGPDITNAKRFAPESAPTRIGNQGAAANSLRFSRESFQPIAAIPTTLQAVPLVSKPSKTHKCKPKR